MAVRIVFASLILIAGKIIFPNESQELLIQLPTYLTAYFLIGYDIISRGILRLSKRHVFDENFLMIVASAGAFALGDFTEGVAVLLLYQIGEFFEDLAIEKSQKNIREVLSEEQGEKHAEICHHYAYEDLGHDHTSHDPDRASRSEQFISRFARIYTPIICAGAVCLAVLIPLFRTLLGYSPGWHEWIYRALVFLVISCPCAVVISIPLCFTAGIGAARRAGILVRDTVTLEKIAYLPEEEIADLIGTEIVITDPASVKKRIENARIIAKKTLRIARQNIWVSIGFKVVCLILGAFGYAPMWLAIFADDGVMILAVFNSMRALIKPSKA